VHWASIESIWAIQDYFGLTAGADLVRPDMDDASMLSGVRCTINNQLRTGTDKGNLTV
jgi:hypothetical protein